MCLPDESGVDGDGIGQDHHLNVLVRILASFEETANPWVYFVRK